jgi:hypothetical protein
VFSAVGACGAAVPLGVSSRFCSIGSRTRRAVDRLGSTSSVVLIRLLQGHCELLGEIDSLWLTAMQTGTDLSGHAGSRCWPGPGRRAPRRWSGPAGRAGWPHRCPRSPGAAAAYPATCTSSSMGSGASTPNAGTAALESPPGGSAPGRGRAATLTGRTGAPGQRATSASGNSAGTRLSREKFASRDSGQGAV